MATFSPNHTSLCQFYKIYIVNHSNRSVTYDFQELTRGTFTKSIAGNPHGSVAPGCTTFYNFDINFNGGESLEKGNIGIITVDNVSVRMRFWSGNGQYINLLGENNFTVTKDKSDFNEVTGNGARITLDGGGHNNDTLDIFLQIYDK